MRGRFAAGLLAACLLAATPARGAVPPGNLLANPGAESAPGATDTSSVPPRGWTVEGPFSAVRYGTSGFPTTADSTALGGGTNFFAGGSGSVDSAATQVVSVAAAAAEIDAGGVSATLSGQLGGFASQTDSATVTATYLDAAGGPHGSLVIGPVTAQDRNSTTTLLARSASGAVPAGTRSITVRIAAHRDEGDYDDGYADNISLSLAGTGGATPVFHKTVGVTPVSGTVLVKTPGSNAFVAVSGSESIPLGSTLDTRHGKLQLASVPKAGGKVQTADFYDGIFKVTQPGTVTELALTEPLAACTRASAAARKPKTRKLWGDGSGSFRTVGRYSAATVRGTVWLVQDSCAGTLTRVKRGSVLVRDNVRHRNIVLGAGRTYTARPH